MRYSLMDIRLDLFDGAGGGAAAPAGPTAGAGTGSAQAQGDSLASPAATRRGKTGDLSNVIYGKAQAPVEQHSAAGSDGSKGEAEAKPGSTPEEQMKEYRDFIKAHKDIHTAEMQKVINKRFGETKNLEAQVSQSQPILDMLMQHYGIEDGDLTKLQSSLETDDEMWAQEAEDAGMSVEQYRKLQRLERQNRALLKEQQARIGMQRQQQQFQKWDEEAVAVKAKYPDFNLQEAVKDQYFRQALQAGVPMEYAYRASNFDNLVSGAVSQQAATTEKQVVDNIRATGMRPQENGTATSQGAFINKPDPKKWTKKDMAEVRRRVGRGEVIPL